MPPIKELVFERTYDAPLAQVWAAWTDPALIRQWWGPDNVSIPECDVDLRVGGTIYIVMEAGEAMGPYKGTRWPMRGTFTLVEPKTRLAYAAKAWTEGQEGATEIDQTTDLSLREENGATKIRIVAAINATGPKAGAAVQGMEYGFNQELAKLEKFLKR